MAGRLNNDSVSFDRTAENLLRTAQIKMSGEQLRQIVLEDGARIRAAQEAGTLDPAFTAADCLADPAQPDGPTRLYHGTDGVMVPVITEHEKSARRKKAEEKREAKGLPIDSLPPRRTGCDETHKEFKALTFYDEPGEHWHESLHFCRRPETGAVVRREAARLGFADADERVAIVDGADWIREQLEELHPQRLPLDGLGLDFYHLSENVHRCRREVFGEKDESGQKWASDLLHTFKHEGYVSSWESLLAWRVGLARSRKKRASADKLLNYVSTRESMIGYPEFRSRGWQIGSGPTESRCKTTTSRLKDRGRRWDPANAEKVSAHTTLQESNQWNQFWGLPDNKSHAACSP